MPPIGQLRSRVRFYEPFDKEDGRGGTTRDWRLALEVDGRLRNQPGREALEAGRLESQVPAVLTIRWTLRAAKIPSEWKAVIAGTDYQIRSIADPDGRRRWLELILERGTGQ